MLVLIIEARRDSHDDERSTRQRRSIVAQGYQHELLVPQTIPYHSAASVGGVVPDDRAVLVQPQSARGAAAAVQRARGIHGETARACLQVQYRFSSSLLVVDKFARLTALASSPFARHALLSSPVLFYLLAYSTSQPLPCASRADFNPLTHSFFEKNRPKKINFFNVKETQFRTLFRQKN